jgi:hypothetical protein
MSTSLLQARTRLLLAPDCAPLHACAATAWLCGCIFALATTIARDAAGLLTPEGGALHVGMHAWWRQQQRRHAAEAATAAGRGALHARVAAAAC